MTETILYATNRMIWTTWRSIEVLCVLVVMYAGFPHVAGIVHGYVAPVMKYPATITKIDGGDDVYSRIWGNSARLQDCDFSELRWYYGKREGRRTQLQLRFLEPPKNRPTGEMTFGPWEIQAPKDLIRDQTFADVRHCNCRIGAISLPYCVWSKFY